MKTRQLVGKSAIKQSVVQEGRSDARVCWDQYGHRARRAAGQRAAENYAASDNLAGQEKPKCDLSLHLECIHINVLLQFFDIMLKLPYS